MPFGSDDSFKMISRHQGDPNLKPRKSEWQCWIPSAQKYPIYLNGIIALIALKCSHFTIKLVNVAAHTGCCVVELSRTRPSFQESGLLDQNMLVCRTFRCTYWSFDRLDHHPKAHIHEIRRISP